jgi:4-hydroxy-4-methyl-2-oxoglutarate aldolase
VDDAKLGDVWVISSGTDQVLSMFGDIIALACKRQGLGGIVTDSGCRDIAVLEEIGLPVFSRGTCLYGPGRVVRPVAANVPVICGGVEVHPGDIVVADIDGILVFPQDALAEVARLKPELEEKEEHARRIIEKNEPLTTSYPL